jgi:hypothetical protein
MVSFRASEASEPSLEVRVVEKIPVFMETACAFQGVAKNGLLYCNRNPLRSLGL